MSKGKTNPSSKYISSEVLSRRLYGIVTLLFICFIVWASLTGPSTKDSTLIYSDLTIERLNYLVHIKSARALIDISTNVTLYIPFGVFLSLAIASRKPRFFSFWIVSGFALSIFMEIIQKSIGRFPDSIDVLMNSSGFLFGYWVCIAAIKYLHLNPSALIGLGDGDQRESNAHSIVALRFIYLCIFFLVTLLPFDLSVDSREVYAKLLNSGTGSPRIILDPFYNVKHWPADWSRLFLAFLSYMPVALLTAYINRLKSRSSVMIPVAACLIVSVISEVMKIFVMSRVSDVVMFPLAMLAGIFGWFAVKSWFGVRAGVEFAQECQDQFTKRRQFFILLAVYAFILCLFAWSPYEFELDAKNVQVKILKGNWIPFYLQFNFRSIGMALDLIKESGLFVPFGIFLATLLRIAPIVAKSQLLIVVLTGLISLGFSFFLETSQALCIGRYVDITDALMAAIGGMVGGAMHQLFHGKPNQSK